MVDEEVNAFDVPVPQLDGEEFDLFNRHKGNWYDHKVSVSNPVASDGATITSTETTDEYA